MKQQQLEEMVELLTKQRDEARNQVDILAASMKTIARKHRWTTFYTEKGESKYYRAGMTMYKEELVKCTDIANAALGQANIDFKGGKKK
ncbi:hypothetical protein BCPG3_109 [Bacillus phage BCPG3]|uniref:Uncharacterized protein n=1 Tax=Bacillus phage BPS13 TaxID=1136731 RepID=J9PUY6_9CAUD|nr:hypothetical protein BPS13_0116 [Bacillus phage BPS13]AEZ50295.1 hypothetical protein BPS13_0116 [Bacillus phage BPS13]QQO38885.1 hypothetical protein BCPG1_154 [Bacillus phage BCPG1]QSJ04426.1 hypothetical protein BCPG3_109 [Bacillus phage BCPG3]QSJ04636.1 hypothetical protein BCP18_104 [Bacillus phage BCP18]